MNASIRSKFFDCCRAAIDDARKCGRIVQQKRIRPRNGYGSPIVEIIGPSCVGKTTLLKSIHRVKIGNLAGDEDYWNFEPPRNWPAALPIEEQWRVDLLNLEIDRIRESALSLSLMPRSIAFVAELSIRDHILTKMDFGCTCVVSEGFTHVFMPSILRSAVSGLISPASVVGARRYIYLTASPQFIAQRVIHRRKSSLYGGYTYNCAVGDDLLKLIDKKIRDCNDFVELAQSCGATVTTINAEALDKSVESLLASDLLEIK